jgi:hypothetical protein
MAYYGKGTKEGIMQDLYNNINGISGIKFVDWQRVYNTGITPDKYPGCFINEIRTDKTKILKNIIKNIFQVGLVCWVYANQGENLGSKMNTFLGSIKTAVQSDPNRNSNAYDTTIDITQTDAGSRHPQGVFIMTLTVIYFSSE